MPVTTADIIMVVVITMDITAAGTIVGIGTTAGTIIAGIMGMATWLASSRLASSLLTRRLGTWLQGQMGSWSLRLA
jgi:hypothetical protein